MLPLADSLQERLLLLNKTKVITVMKASELELELEILWPLLLRTPTSNNCAKESFLILLFTNSSCNSFSSNNHSCTLLSNKILQHSCNSFSEVAPEDLVDSEEPLVALEVLEDYLLEQSECHLKKWLQSKGSWLWVSRSTKPQRHTSLVIRTKRWPPTSCSRTASKKKMPLSQP